MSQESQDQNPENTAEPATAHKPAPDVMPSTEELLRKAELDAQEHHDAWLRAKAETENIRKRAVTDVANAHKYAVEGFATELLAVRGRTLSDVVANAPADRYVIHAGRLVSHSVTTHETAVPAPARTSILEMR